MMEVFRKVKMEPFLKIVVAMNNKGKEWIDDNESMMEFEESTYMNGGYVPKLGDYVDDEMFSWRCKV